MVDVRRVLQRRCIQILRRIRVDVREVTRTTKAVVHATPFGPNDGLPYRVYRLPSPEHRSPPRWSPDTPAHRISADFGAAVKESCKPEPGVNPSGQDRITAMIVVQRRAADRGDDGPRCECLRAERQKLPSLNKEGTSRYIGMGWSSGNGRLNNERGRAITPLRPSVERSVHRRTDGLSPSKSSLCDDREIDGDSISYRQRSVCNLLILSSRHELSPPLKSGWGL
jgi:hypothetical protein